MCVSGSAQFQAMLFKGQLKFEACWEKPLPTGVDLLQINLNPFSLEIEDILQEAAYEIQMSQGEAGACCSSAGILAGLIFQ